MKPSDFLTELLLFLEDGLGVGEDRRLEFVSELVTELLVFLDEDLV